MRMQMTREFYIPKAAVKVADKNSGAVVYVYEMVGRLYAMGFLPKANKPLFNNIFMSPQARENRVRDFFKSVTARQTEMAERRKARNAPHNVEVGAIFYTSWGYDQTNVDFYQVVRVIGGQSVEIRKICQNRTENGYETGTCVAVKHAFVNEAPMRKRISMSGGKPSLTVDGNYATIWDGKAVRWSSYH